MVIEMMPENHSSNYISSIYIVSICALKTDFPKFTLYKILFHENMNVFFVRCIRKIYSIKWNWKNILWYIQKRKWINKQKKKLNCDSPNQCNFD